MKFLNLSLFPHLVVPKNYFPFPSFHFGKGSNIPLCFFSHLTPQHQTGVDPDLGSLGFAPLYMLSWAFLTLVDPLLQQPSSISTESLIFPNPFNDQQLPVVLALREVSSDQQIEPQAPAEEAQSLNHLTAKKFPVPSSDCNETKL